MQVKCSKCSQPIALTDIIESSNGRLSHIDCKRPHTLTPEERALLFVYCSDHAVARCLACDLTFRMTALAADPLGGRTNLCPRCRQDLTENVRSHLFRCILVPAEIRLKAQQVREAAQILMKHSQQLAHTSNIQDAEADLFEQQRALRAAMARRSAS